MYGRFNNSFQQNGFQNNNPGLQGSNNIYPYPQQYFTPPTPQMPQMAPQEMNQDMYQQDQFQPFQSPQPFDSSGQFSSYSPYTDNYAKGGQVKQNRISGNSYSSLAELIRQQGEGEDKILAHINPIEAQMLARESGGDINPTTGLPQFGLFRNPGKWLKGSLGGIGGAILGNMILPGIGGVIGSGLGSAAGSAIRGRKDYLQSAIRGAGIGAALPTVAGLAGTAASKLGMGGIGNYLTNYGGTNAILPSFDKLMGTNIAGNSIGAIGQGADANPLTAAISPENAGAAEKGFLATLGQNSKDFLTDPKNLLTLGVVGSSFLNRPKEKSPEKLSAEHKRYHEGLMLTPAERAKKEAHDIEARLSQQRIDRSFIPENRFEIPERYRRTRTPEEYKNTGNWFEWYNNPDFMGTSIPYYKDGGSVSNTIPNGLSGYIKGVTGGQDDKRKVLLPDGAYVVNASVVGNLGDGNSEAGAKKIDAYISDGEYVITPDKVASKFGNGSHNKGVKTLDRMMRNVQNHKGGSVKLPPKAKSLADYMR